MISIVMSCYNAEKTIDRAIGSILSQTFQDFEVIVVNDCSTDGSEAIVRRISENDDRVRLINHERNMGAGLARRTAIENMRGDYMTFCDSDDYLKPDCLERLMSAMNTHDVDIVAGGFSIVDQDGNILEERIPDRVIQEKGAKFRPNKQDTKRFMISMLIKSSIWENVTYSSRRYIEDTPTLVQVLYYAKRIMMLDYAGYYYVQNQTSLTHTTNASKDAVFRALCAMDIWLFFKDKVECLSDPKAFMALYNHAVKMLNVDKKASMLYEAEMKEMRSCIKNIKRT